MVMHDPEQRSVQSHPLKIRIHRDSTSKNSASPVQSTNNGITSGPPNSGGSGTGASGGNKNKAEELVMSPVDDRELEESLPKTFVGQVPLGVAVSRIVQHAYAELGNMAETLPSQADHDRKRHIFQYALTTRKGFVKMYVATKWADNARAVQTCLDIMQYCNRAGEQLQLASTHLATIAGALGPLRLRNADLLTALDVLGTGTYRRLPSITKELYAPQKPMTREDVVKIMRDADSAIRLRLRTKEIVPLEMGSYRVADGRVYFTVPDRFAASFTVLGGTLEDPWWCADVEFLFEVKGERSIAIQNPRILPKQIRSGIQHETNLLLAKVQNQRTEQITEDNDLASIARNSNVVDAPLVRAFNFLQLLSLTYQLEILHAQANLMRNMGYSDVLTVELARDRRSMRVLYWVSKNRRAIQIPGKPELQLPPHGGEITISIELTSEVQRRERARERERERKAKGKTRAGPSQSNHSGLSLAQTGIDVPQPMQTAGGQSWADRIRADLERRSKLTAHASSRVGAGVNLGGATSGSGLGGDVGGIRPSDEAEYARFVVKWEPASDWLGIGVPREQRDELDLQVDASALNFATIYHAVVRKHSDAVTRALHVQVPEADLKPFGHAGHLAMIQSRIMVSIVPRTGLVLVQDTADMASPGRVGRFSQAGEAVSRQPQALGEQVALLNFAIIADSVEQQVRFLGYRCSRHRGFPPRYQVLHQKFGQGARHFLFTPLAGFPAHDVVIIVADEGFRYAIIETETEAGYSVWKDGALLDIKAIRRQKNASAGSLASLETEHPRPDFEIDAQALRDIHAYCRARASYARIEAQFRNLGLPYNIAYSKSQPPPPGQGYPLSRSIPALAISAKELFKQAAQPTGDQDVEDNVAVEVFGWWQAGPQSQCRVATSIRLKRAPPVSADLRKKNNSRGEVLRITSKLYYNTSTHVVTFVSENADACVAAFLVEWTSVRRLIVIAREVVKMHKTMQWRDVKLLSSDLQQVVFQYFQDYTLSIRWRSAIVEGSALSPSIVHGQNDAGSYELSFSRLTKENQNPPDSALWNPHCDLEKHFTRRLQDDLAAGDIASFASLLRDSLPVLLEIERVATCESINGRIDILYKAVGWYRILIDSRYALDFRLLSKRRLAILDGTQVLERSSQPQALAQSAPNSILSPIPHIEAVASRLVAERRAGPAPAISLTKGVLVSFTESGMGLENLGVRFAELVVKALTMGEAGLT